MFYITFEIMVIINLIKIIICIFPLVVTKFKAILLYSNSNQKKVLTVLFKIEKKLKEKTLILTPNSTNSYSPIYSSGGDGCAL